RRYPASAEARAVREDRQTACARLDVVAALCEASGPRRAPRVAGLAQQELVALQRRHVVEETLGVRLTRRDVGFPRPVAVAELAFDARHDLEDVVRRLRRDSVAEEIQHPEQCPCVCRWRSSGAIHAYWGAVARAAIQQDLQ